MKKISVALYLLMAVYATGAQAQLQPVQGSKPQETPTERIYQLLDQKSKQTLSGICTKDVSDPKKCTQYAITKYCTAPESGKCNAELIWNKKKASCSAENGAQCAVNVPFPGEDWKNLSLPE